MSGIVTLDDKRIKGLLQHPTVPKLFPCFPALQTAVDNEARVRKTKRCPKCWNEAARNTTAAVQVAKNCIAHMSPGLRGQLKAALGADKIRMTVTGKNRTIVLQF